MHWVQGEEEAAVSRTRGTAAAGLHAAVHEVAGHRLPVSLHFKGKS